MIKINKSYIFISLFIAIILCAAMLFVGLYSTDKVYADYEDLDPNAVVNFNQIINIETFSFTGTGWQRNIFSYSFDSSHYYYVSGMRTGHDVSLFFSNGSTTQLILNINSETKIDTVIQPTQAFSQLDVYKGGNCEILHLNIIDLTVMFGSNENVPTLEQCRDLFISDYYPYTLGTSLVLNSLIDYSEAYNSGYDVGYDIGYANGSIDEYNNNHIVYFNQLIENDNQSVDINHGSNFGLYDIQPITMFNNHKYYISLTLPYDDILRFGIDWGSDNFTELISFPTYPLKDDHKYSGIFTGQNTVINNIEQHFAYANNTQYTRYNGLNVIDLTAMYGSDDNIPTLELLDNIFASRPYYYNEGTVSYSSSVDQYQIGYINGFNAAYDSQNVVVNSYVIGSNAFPMNYDDVTSSFAFDDTYNQFKFYGYIGIPMGNLVSGTLIDVDFTFFVSSFSGLSEVVLNNYKLNFYSYQYTFMNKIGSVDLYYSNSNTYRYKGTISLNTDLDTIYCSLTTGSNYVEALVQSSQFTFRTANIQAAIDNAFNEGVQSVYNIYQEGGVKYNQIYNAGRTAGINERNPYTFSALMSSVVEAPLNAVLSIFNFDFLGYNMKSFVTLLLTMCLLLAIVRLFMGNSNA